MQLTILQTSSFALKYLDLSSELTIHSVYQKAVNLKVNEQLLTLQPRDSVLSPISLITSCSETEFISLPFIAGKQLRIPLNTRQTSCQDLFLPFDASDSAPAFLYLPELKRKIRNAIAAAGQSTLPPHMRGMELILNCPDLPDDSLYMKAASQYLTQLFQISEASKDRSEMASCLCRLIGLGIGLTPSGDDFICGFLAGLRISSSVEASAFLTVLGQKVCQNLNRTNEISAAFLRCAVSGQFSAPVHLLTVPNVTARQIYQAFSQIGHSSGIDTLCGIYTALSLSL